MIDLKYQEMVKSLSPRSTVKLETGRDHLDLVALREYGSYNYWMPLAVYNDIINPFSLRQREIHEIDLFDKAEYDKKMRELKRNDRASQ